MLGWHKESTADRLSRRIAALKDELDGLQSSLWPRHGGFERLVSDTQDWMTERAGALPRISLPDVRRHLPAHRPPLAVVAAALAVGAGVGCVLYALASSGKGRPAHAASKDDVRRPSSGGVE